MKVKGELIFSPDYDVDEGILTPKRFAADWTEGHERWCLVAESKDGGKSYRGKIGSPELEEGSKVELYRYRSSLMKNVFLFGWAERTLVPQSFNMTFVLEPDETEKKRR